MTITSQSASAHASGKGSETCLLPDARCAYVYQCKNMRTDLLRLLVQPPLFPSDCEFAQLLTIFQILGTPTEETWPGVTDLKDWHLYPQWPAVDMVKYMEGVLDADGVDLLMQMLRYDPNKRLSVRAWQPTCGRWRVLLSR